MDTYNTNSKSAEELMNLYFGLVDSESGDIPVEDNGKAFAYLQAAADKGSPEAWAELGACYFMGFFVDKDEKKAFDYLEKAALRGVANAQMNLYIMMWGNAGDEEERESAIYWLNQAAENNVPSALYETGTLYYNGLIHKQDFDKAAHYYKLSAGRGSSEALAMLGVLYQQGQGVEKDLIRSAKCFADAMEKGSLTGLYNLGNAFMGGLGVDQDYEEAMNCFEILTDLEDPFFEMPDISEIKTRSDISLIFHMTKVYELVYPLAHHNLGIMYQQGLGAEVDAKSALYHFMLASENGYAPSCLQAGTMLYTGEALEKSEPEKAFEYLTVAYNAGIPESKLCLGMMYYYGEGAPADKEKGIAMLDELISAGNVAAIQVKKQILAEGK